MNVTGEMERPIEKVLPLSDLHFEIDLGGFGIEKESYKISSVRGGKLSKISQNGDKVSFDLDKLDEYEVVVIE